MKRLSECLCVLLFLTRLSANAAESEIELKSGQEVCAIFKEMKATLKELEVERKVRVKIGKGETLSGVLSLTSYL
jgi:molybdopterin-binding protein